MDRAVFNSTGNRQSFSESDWTDAIDQEAAKSAAATLQLVNATLDKTNSNTYQLHADVKVTLTQPISDSLLIRYAIVEDGLKDDENGGTLNVTLNDVVRYITYSNSDPFVVVAGGASTGTKEMTWDVSLPGPTNISYRSPNNWDYTKIRLVAFLESTHNGDFQVVNAAVLRQDLDTLQSPPPTLAITSSGLDGAVLDTGSNAQISYTETNLTNGVDAYYSLNNDTTWTLIANSITDNPFNWTVPDSLTTQGKIKLVSVDFPNLTSTESGNFTIAPGASVTFVRPHAGEVLDADSSYMIEWTKNGVDSVKLQYSLSQNGGFSTWSDLGDNITDTFYKWTVPDANIAVELQLVPFNNEAPAASVIDTIEKLFPNSVTSASAEGALAITDIFPNPAANGEGIVLRYTENRPRAVSVQVLDLLGRVMTERYRVDNQAIYLDTHALAPGAYIVRVTDGVNVVSKRVEILQ